MRLNTKTPDPQRDRRIIDRSFIQQEVNDDREDDLSLRHAQVCALQGRAVQCRLQQNGSGAEALQHLVRQ